MSSSLESQAKTEELFRLQPQKVVPAFGLHPWFTSSISLMDGAESGDQELDKRAHYREILVKKHYPTSSIRSSDNQGEDAGRRKDRMEICEWIDCHLHLLPNPIRLKTFLVELRERLMRFPTSMMGEIGLDKAFTFHIKPSSAINPTKRSNENNDGDQPVTEDRVIKSKYKVSIIHQLEILRKQIELAIELRRPISLHCVQAPTEVLGLIDELIGRWGVRFTGLLSNHPTTKKKSKTGAARMGNENLTLDPADSEGDQEHGINLCWHSPNISVEVLQQTLRKLPQTAYFSYSSELAILFDSRAPSNKVHPGPAQPQRDETALDKRYSTRAVQAIRATPLDRLLLESDHGADPVLIDNKLQQIFHLVRIVKAPQSGSSGLPSDDYSWDSHSDRLARQIETNWNRFYSGA
jgi:Tat protein secretion system quality control protein TatD with DNase activity